MSMPRNLPQRFRCLLSRPIAIAALLALTMLPARSAWASDSVEKQLKSEYSDKVLALRHFYSGDHLKFRPDGTLEGYASTGPWTLDGQIEVQEIHLRGAQLMIKGRRIHSIFDAQHNPQDELTTIGDHPDKQRKDLEKYLRHLKVEIEIELPSDPSDERVVASAMNAVFLASSESMMEVMPSYWRAYFAKREGKPAPQVKGPAYTFKSGEGMSLPRADVNPDPEYSEEARKAKYQGSIVLSLVVDASGTPRELQIVTPLGLGLDEQAIRAVNSWRFRPGATDGEPVSVAISVEVSFHLF
jgi:TonB family protein